MIETGKIINGDCREEMGKLPEGSVDLIVTSPPYNCNINYDTHQDDMTMENYWVFTEEWLTQAEDKKNTIGNAREKACGKTECM